MQSPCHVHVRKNEKAQTRCNTLTKMGSAISAPVGGKPDMSAGTKSALLPPFPIHVDKAWTPEGVHREDVTLPAGGRGLAFGESQTLAPHFLAEEQARKPNAVPRTQPASPSLALRSSPWRPHSCRVQILD